MSRYREYLASDEWREIRDGIRARADGKCEMCGAPMAHVHHVEYPKRYGEEHPDSLLAVCEKCHRLQHGIRDMKTLVEAKRVEVEIEGLNLIAGVTPEKRVYSTAEQWAGLFPDMPKDFRVRWSGLLATCANALDKEYEPGTHRQEKSGREVFRYSTVFDALDVHQRQLFPRWSEFSERNIGSLSDEDRKAFQHFKQMRKHRRNVVRIVELAIAQAFEDATSIVPADDAKPPSSPMEELIRFVGGEAALKQFAAHLVPVIGDHEQRIAETAEQTVENTQRIEVVEQKLSGPTVDMKAFRTINERFVERSMNIAQCMPGTHGDTCMSAVGRWCRKHCEEHGVQRGGLKTERLPGVPAKPYPTWPRWFIDMGIAELMDE